MSPTNTHVAHHLQLDQAAIKGATYALLPGDPGRVPLIAEHLKDAREVSNQREFRSYLGDLDGQPVLVTSTGCGGPSVSICVEELASIGVTSFIRVGSTGAIQQYIDPGDLVISTAAVRLEGASRSFAPIEYPAVADLTITNALVSAAGAAGIPFHVGITASTDTFFQGQERYNTHTGYMPRHLRGSLEEWTALRVLNFEMEAATLFTMCSTMGLRAGTVCGVAANRARSNEIVGKELFRQCEQNATAAAIGALRLLLKEPGRK